MSNKSLTFKQLKLSSNLLSILQELGYETPTAVQAASIPILLAGRDLLAQAQTGTGKTAAFALPILSMIDLAVLAPQALVITPTRELTIQVAEAFQRYAKSLPDFHVLPIYGGQEYKVQLRALKRGPHVVVGTPGRIMDHLRQGKLDLSALRTIVLDEADEMLNMGFIDDIQWIFTQLPSSYQTALFSATLPPAIKNIAKRYLHHAEHVAIAMEQKTATTIEQSYYRIAQRDKLAVLTRYLETEDINAAIIFSRTKNWATELAEKLQARGYAAAPLHGDIAQALRKKVIDRLKAGSLDIIVATDVAARGIDVERVSHVINYDIPHDVETYVHRIGRTGRAGRSGKAILFITPREQRLLQLIEHTLKLSLTQKTPPSQQEMAEKRQATIQANVVRLLNETTPVLNDYKNLLNTLQAETGKSLDDVAAALAHLALNQRTAPVSDVEDEINPKKPMRTSKKQAVAASSKRRSAGKKPLKPKKNRKDNAFKPTSSAKKTSHKPRTVNKKRKTAKHK